MNQPVRIALLCSAAWLSLNTSPGWAAGYPAPMTNNTASDACGDTADGTQALFNNSRCNAYNNSNAAFAYNALTSNIDSYQNTADGASALFSNTWGGANFANAVNALYSDTTGTNNTAAGYSALAIKPEPIPSRLVIKRAILSSLVAILFIWATRRRWTKARRCVWVARKSAPISRGYVRNIPITRPPRFRYISTAPASWGPCRPRSGTRTTSAT
jgi:hypothetical protein